MCLCLGPPKIATLYVLLPMGFSQNLTDLKIVRWGEWHGCVTTLFEYIRVSYFFPHNCSKYTKFLIKCVLTPMRFWTILTATWNPMRSKAIEMVYVGKHHTCIIMNIGYLHCKKQRLYGFVEEALRLLFSVYPSVWVSRGIWPS